MPQQVLLIDDSQPIHALVREWLAHEHLKLLSAFSGADGLKSAQNSAPDLILLDMDLPDLSGLELCRRLKAEAATCAIPVVYLVGNSVAEKSLEGLELGATDFIAKPFHPPELRARVRAALRTKHLMDLLEKKARVDGLTGLWNRTFFENRVKQESSLARRANRALSSIRIDIDQFKSINAEYGFAFGDDVLRRVAGALCESTRLEDVVCRIGPDEFGILCPNTSAADATFLVSRCRQKFAAIALQCRDKTIGISCTFRITEESTRGISPVHASVSAGA